MKRNCYLAVVKHTTPAEEYPIRLNKKGFFGNLYIYQLRSQRIYASMLTYPGALYYKFISPLFPFRNEDGTPVKRQQAGRIIIRTV